MYLWWYVKIELLEIRAKSGELEELLGISRGNFKKNAEIMRAGAIKDKFVARTAILNEVRLAISVVKNQFVAENRRLEEE